TRLLFVGLLAPVLAPTARAQVLLAEWSGPHTSAQLGSTLRGGDLNGDGLRDVLAAARNAQVNGAAVGRVIVYSGLDNSVLLDLPGPQSGSAFGFSADFVGDLNGDGWSEVIVGAPFYQAIGSIQNGRAAVFNGQTGAEMYAYEGSSLWDWVGWSVAGIGDLDGDLVPDFAIGSPGLDNQGPDAGGVLLYSGATGNLFNVVGGVSAGDLAGRSVVGLGDLNGDGHSEFAVSMSLNDAAGFDAGLVAVHSGSSATWLYEVPGSYAGHNFGEVLAAVGDLDGDGHTDWASGSPGDGFGGNLAGSFRVHSGLTGGLLFSGVGAPNDFLGAAISRAGDVDGDSVPDLAVSATGDSTFNSRSGRVDVHSGAGGALICSFYGEGSLARLGEGLALAGDRNGDGVPDLAMGLPGVNTTSGAPAAVWITAGCRPAGQRLLRAEPRELDRRIRHPRRVRFGGG
ncbi:MAG: integrin alpha, partial [Planctomycetota bacterium]